MRLVIVLLTTAIVQVSAATYGQRINLVEKNTPLEQVLKKIKQQTGYDVLYKDNTLEKAKPVSITLKNTELTSALEKLMESQPLEFEIDQKTILIKEKEKGFLDNIIARFQSIDVKGKVVDSLGNGLAGATVSVKGGKQSTQTAANGDFYLKNVEEGAVLIINYLGYVTKEAAVVKDFMSIKLEQSTSKLDEVQVMAYGTTSRRLSTGNIFTIKGSELNGQPVNNPLLTLIGRVPNLNISPSSGLPGAKIDVQLRGQNSLAQSSLRSEPLFIIDGVPISNTITSAPLGGYGAIGNQISLLSYLNLSDIEQIDILTDADATSIYGSRGANGVVLITTRRGRPGETKIDATIISGVSQIGKSVPMMNTEQYLAMRREAFVNDGLTVPTLNTPIKSSSNFDLTLWDPNSYTDWQKKFLGGNAKNIASNLSISGGAGNFSFLLAGTHNGNGSVFTDKAKSQMSSVSVNLTGNGLKGKLQTSFNGAYSHDNNFAPSVDWTSLLRLPPNAPSVYTTDGDLNWQPNPNDPARLGSWKNPLADLERTNETSTIFFRSSFDISYQIWKNLVIKANAGLIQSGIKSLTLEPISANDPALVGTTGNAIRTNSNFNSLSFEPQLVYRATFQKSRLEFLTGASMQNQNDDGESILASGYKSDASIRNLAAAGSYVLRNSSAKYKYLALFGRLNYNFSDRFLFSFSFRRDGSSRFAKDYQFGDFWSLGTAWVLSNESFIKDNLPFLSFAKLRGSYGISGHDGIGDYQYLELFKTDASVEYQNVKVIESSGAYNNDYHWESLKKLELAAETGFFSDRLLFNLAYFRNRGADQLGQFLLPATAGASAIVINQNAKIQNSGWEIVINSKNIDGGDFKWSTGLNFSIQRNKVLRIPKNSNYGLPRYVTEGEPYSGIVFVNKFKGVNVENGIYQFLKNDASVSPTDDLQYEDAKRIDILPRTVGLNNTLRYRNLSLDFFIQLTQQVGKNYIYDSAFYRPGSFNSSSASVAYSNLPVAFLNHWRNPGDLSNIQKFTTGFNYLRYAAIAGNSDIAFEDASFVKLRNVVVSYNVQSKHVTKLGLRTVRVFVQGQNLFTITSFNGLDPEVQAFGKFPLLRTFMAGLSIGL